MEGDFALDFTISCPNYRTCKIVSNRDKQQLHGQQQLQQDGKQLEMEDKQLLSDTAKACLEEYYVQFVHFWFYYLWFNIVTFLLLGQPALFKEMVSREEVCNWDILYLLGPADGLKKCFTFFRIILLICNDLQYLVASYLLQV